MDSAKYFKIFMIIFVSTMKFYLAKHHLGLEVHCAFQPSVAFPIETVYLIYTANHMIGFCII